MPQNLSDNEINTMATREAGTQSAKRKPKKNIGNKFWMKRSRHGRNPLFETPADLEKACNAYFNYVHNNPLYEEKAFQHAGNIVTHDIVKMHAMTITGLCVYLDISHDTWRNYRKKKDFLGVIERAELIIKTQKFTGAAAGLLDSNIIARDLGLADRKDHTSSDGTMTPRRNFNDFYQDEQSTDNGISEDSASD